MIDFVISDMQVPDHDVKALDSVLSFIEYLQPDRILIVGDELDSPQPSRWNKGYAGEYAGTLQRDIDTAHEVLRRIRAVVAERPVHLMRSNHGERIRTYLNRYAPALAGLKTLDYSTLLGLDALGITYHEQPFEFTRGWVLAHGDEGSLTQTAGGTALGLAKRWNKSVVCGHTHRAGIQHHHSYLNNRASSLLFGLEVGHLMDMRKANYLKAGSANWQQAVGIVETQGKVSVPTLVPLFNSRILWNGRTF